MKAEGAGPTPTLPLGTLVPGIPNLHSHAFQRGFAGLAERRAISRGDFWSWREAMYRMAGRLSPDDVRAIATQLFIEMVKAGYTAVSEFHYLHNNISGDAYACETTMCTAIVEAAQTAGIDLTLVPVLYTSSDFGGLPPLTEQRRFVQTIDRHLRLVSELQSLAGTDGFTVALGFHSLRACTPTEMTKVLAAFSSMPVHIHIAEQVREVDACLAWSRARPVEWLLGEFDVDPRWYLVHATHMTDVEALALAESGATVVLCPSTEANLGDGLFNADAYFGAGGRWGIGSDSHVVVDPREELRLLECGRRLQRQARTLSATMQQRHVGAWLWEQAAGASAAAGLVAPGGPSKEPRSFLVLEDEHPQLIGARPGHDELLDALVFVNVGSSPIREVWVNGRRIVHEGHHAFEDQAVCDYRAALARVRDCG